MDKVDDFAKPRQRLSRRAGAVARALADATEAMGRDRPRTVDMGGVELQALEFDQARRQTADSAVAGFATAGERQPRRGRGDDFWYRQVNVIKFVFLGDLAAGWQATREAEYAEAARDYFADFFDYFDGAPWDDAGVRIAVRVINWLDYLPYFLNSDAFDAVLLSGIAASARDQLNYLLADEKKPGNVRLFQANAFLRGRLLLPDFEESEAWIREARDIYADTAFRDLEPDGSHTEHEPNYHGLYQSTFENLLLWSKAFPDEEIPCFPELAAGIFDYAVASHRPNGEVCGLQDGAGAWLADGSTMPLLKRRSRIRRLAGLGDEPPPLAQIFPDAGQVYMRTGWGVKDSYMTVDATRWGGAHSHLARNGIQLHAFGRTLVTDPGFFTYAMQHASHRGDDLTNRIGPYAKSTPAHNTLNLNGWNQAPTNPDLLSAHFSPHCHAVVSRYSGGYWPGWYGWWFGDGFGAGVHAEHERILVWLPDRAAIVIDTMMRWDEAKLGGPRQQAPTLEMNWQLTPGPVELDAENRRVITRNDDANVLLLFPRLAKNMALCVSEGQTDPFRGWVGTGRTAKAPLQRAGVFEAPERAQWRDRGYMPAPQVCAVADPMVGFGETLVTVLVPFEGSEVPKLEAVPGGVACAEFADGKGHGMLDLNWGNGGRDTVVWTPGLRSPILSHGRVRTDASVLHLRTGADGNLVSGTALDATYCEPFAPDRRPRPGSIQIAS